MSLSQENRFKLLAYIDQEVGNDASLGPEVIEAATEGIKRFAEDHSGKAGKIAFALMDLLMINPKLASPAFDNDHIVDFVRPYFYGTDGLRKIEEERRKSS